MIARGQGRIGFLRGACEMYWNTGREMRATAVAAFAAPLAFSSRVALRGSEARSRLRREGGFETRPYEEDPRRRGRMASPTNLTA